MLFYVDLISKVVVILLQFIQISDCFSFDNSYGDKTIDANHTGSAIIKFRYIPGSEDRSKTAITCGYFNSQRQLIRLIKQTGRNEPRRLSDNNVFGSRATVFTDSKLEKKVIGITLTNIQRTDPRMFQCSSSFVISSSAAQQSVTSDVKELRVLGNI